MKHAPLCNLRKADGQTILHSLRNERKNDDEVRTKEHVLLDNATMKSIIALYLNRFQGPFNHCCIVLLRNLKAQTQL